MSIKVAIYARVSTQDQDPGLQLSELRRYVQDRGWQVYQEYVDVGQSGAKGNRPELNKLMAGARRRKFNILLCWKLDRLGRNLKHLILTLEELQSLGITFVSITETLDGTTPMGKAMLGMLGILAEFEREMIVERVKAGMRRAREMGKAVGRPKKEIDPEEFAVLRGKGLNMEEIAQTLGVSRATLFNRNGSLKRGAGNGDLQPLTSQEL